MEGNEKPAIESELDRILKQCTFTAFIEALSDYSFRKREWSEYIDDREEMDYWMTAYRYLVTAFSRLSDCEYGSSSR